MKDKLKNPNLYYILAPVLAGIWAILAGFVFYPGSVKTWQEDIKPEYEESQDWMYKLIELQPQRLQFQVKQGNKVEFDFGKTVDTLTQFFRIPPSKYTLSVRKPVNRAGKKTWTSSMSFKEIDIETTGRFLSTILEITSDLKCDQISIDKAKNGEDNWNVDLTMTYRY